MSYHALIPVKSLTTAKSRLQNYLSLDQRKKLVFYMLNHVITVLHSQKRIEKIYVVSSDRSVLTFAEQKGIIPMRERQVGLNPALTAAAAKISEKKIDGLLTIFADLPIVTKNDIQQLIELSNIYDVVLSPSKEGTGTNAILVKMPLSLPYLFGENSFQKYKYISNKNYVSAGIYISQTMGFDIDTIEDFKELKKTEDYKINFNERLR